MIPILDENKVLHNVKFNINPFLKDYYAFYSSWYGGIILNPNLMLLPIDDHMVHRGDGVFEAMKSVDRKVYLMDEHLQRLFISAEKIYLESPFSFEQIKEIVLETLRAADRDEAIIRIFLSRGPGNFSVNPYDAVAAQLYVVITKPHPLPLEKYNNGVIIGKSHVPAKSSWLSQVKSCNYLPNVLMKKEAVDRNLDFVIGLDDENSITESATENIMIVDENNTIVYPTLQNVLKGTTMIRACELAQAAGWNVESRNIFLSDLLHAREVIMTGTTLNVISVVQFEDQLIAEGKPGVVATMLSEMISKDMKNGGKSTEF